MPPNGRRRTGRQAMTLLPGTMLRGHLARIGTAVVGHQQQVRLDDEVAGIDGQRRPEARLRHLDGAHLVLAQSEQVAWPNLLRMEADGLLETFHRLTGSPLLRQSHGELAAGRKVIRDTGAGSAWRRRGRRAYPVARDEPG